LSKSIPVLPVRSCRFCLKPKKKKNKKYSIFIFHKRTVGLARDGDSGHGSFEGGWARTLGG
jgi:hypothetical protein